MRLIEEIEGLVVNQVGAIKSLITLTRLELQLAGLSVYPLLITVCMVFTVLITLWVTTMAGLVYGIVWLYHSPIVAFASVLLINLLLLGLLLIYLIFNLKQMSFAKTRAYLGSMSQPGGNHESTTRGDQSNNDHVTTHTEPTSPG